MKTWVLLCLIALLPAYARSQRITREELYTFKPDTKPSLNKARVDSLIRLTNHRPDDTFKVSLYSHISALYHNTKNDSASIFAWKAHALSEKLQYVKGICHSLSSLGNYYGTFGTNEFDKSMYYYRAQADVAEKHGLKKELQDAFSCMLNLCFYTGDFPQAMKLSTKALTIAEKNNDTQKIAYYNNLLGFIYLRQGNPEDSRKYYQRYFENASLISDSTMMADARIGLAEVFLFEKKNEEALPLLFQARDYYLNRIHRIGINFLKAEKIPYTMFILAKAYHAMGDHQQALEYCLRGFAFSKRFPFNLYDLANYYIITGNVYEDAGQMDKAVETLQSGLTLSLEIKHAENVRDAYQSLSRIYARQKIFEKAYHYEQLFNQMKDSIINERTRREIEHINAEYNLVKKDQEMQQQKQLHSAEIARQNIITGSVIAFFLLLTTMSALLYNRYRLKQKTEFQEELNRKQNELFNTVTSIQDKERKRIAQDIHDQVGSVLSAAKLQLSGLEELKGDLTDDQKRKYASAMMLMDEAAEELRNISHNLMPATLSRLGLVAALRGLFDKISEYSGLTINFNSYGFEKRVDEPIEINIYPMVLELINNVVKHAQATAATIQLIKYPEYINITVEDNGRGFDKMGQHNDGIGMRSLRSRIEYLKGNINIDSVEGKGTTIMIDIPVTR